MDEIKIEDLEIYAYHGVFEEEKKQGQAFLISAVLSLDLRKAGKNDDLALSVHYGEVCQRISACFTEKSFDLIEAAAEYTAQDILLHFPGIQRIVIEVKKPHAPIGLPFRNVSVSIERGWKKAYLGMGSNLGNKEAQIAEAIRKIKEDPNIREVRCSSLQMTKPYGNVEQEDFLNGVLEIQTLYTPYELLKILQRMELEAGRERLIHWGPRTLDLDILFFEGFLSDDPHLTVPHPDMQNRGFVLEPLYELCPYYVNQALGKSVKVMLQELQNRKHD